MKTTILSILTFVLLSGCGEETKVQEKKSKTVLDTQINAIQDAKKNVAAVNAKTAQIHKSSDISTNITGADLYAQKCASCHGKDAKKSALNVSQPIAGWSSSKLSNALNGYKAGTFGGKMKGLMQGQSKPLSDADIKLLSDYISIL
jgi:cytochrome c553